MSSYVFLYVATARVVYRAQIDNPASWVAELNSLFPTLRDSLICCVCHSILSEPCSPCLATSPCEHFICKDCLHREKQLMEDCIKCRNHNVYMEDEELSNFVECYNKMCIYIKESQTLMKYLTEYGGAMGSDLINIIFDGEPYLPSKYSSSSGSSSNTYHSPTPSPPLSLYNGNSRSPEPKPMYSVLVTGDGNKITIKRKPPEEPYAPVVSSRLRSSKSSTKTGGCRCGLATAAPGKLTCCGQRCLCYTEQKPCKGCKCRGCRNPHTGNGTKKLRGLEEYQLALKQLRAKQNSTDIEEQSSDPTVKIVGINSSNNFQVIEYLNQNNVPPDEPS